MYYLITYEPGGQIFTHRKPFPSRKKAEEFKRLMKTKLSKKTKCKIIFLSYPLRY